MEFWTSWSRLTRRPGCVFWLQTIMGTSWGQCGWRISIIYKIQFTEFEKKLTQICLDCPVDKASFFCHTQTFSKPLTSIYCFTYHPRCAHNHKIGIISLSNIHLHGFLRKALQPAETLKSEEDPWKRFFSQRQKYLQKVKYLVHQTNNNADKSSWDNEFVNFLLSKKLLYCQYLKWLHYGFQAITKRTSWPNFKDRLVEFSTSKKILECWKSFWRQFFWWLK